MRPAVTLLALALGTAVTACTDDPGEDEAAPPAATSPAASAPPTAGPAPPGGSTTPPSEPGQPASEPFPADVSPDVGEPSGGPLTVRAVRVARQEGYDRVVFELAGRQPGEAGWRVAYVDDPRRQGSGDPVAVEGESVLEVLITGTGYPGDTGVEEVTRDPDLPPDLAVVEDVVLGAVFEGQYDAFIGTSGRRPFRVFRLGGPERVVVDVRAR